MVMVRNSLPVSDIKIYSTDTHPPPPCHTHIHHPHPELSLYPIHYKCTLPFSLSILLFLSPTHCYWTTLATRPCLCSWEEKLWKWFSVYMWEVSEKAEDMKSPSLHWKHHKPQWKKKTHSGWQNHPSPLCLLNNGLCLGFLLILCDEARVFLGWRVG